MENETKLVKNPETLVIQLTQTAKGFWYLERLTASGADVESLKKSLDAVCKVAIAKLNHLNVGEDEDES